jgi:hypothetical protein
MESISPVRHKSRAAKRLGAVWSIMVYMLLEGRGKPIKALGADETSHSTREAAVFESGTPNIR